MTTRTKEEQEKLEERIARINKKEEEILRRKKEIEEDIRLAGQKDALVKLRPSTTNFSRERTPALRPSNRELREDFSDESFQEPVVQRGSRDGFRGRGVDRYRGQGDWKAAGPPPDPKSFLYDDERDAPLRDKEEKRLDGRNRDDRELGEHRGGREFQRGGRRGAGNDVASRRGHGGPRGRGGVADDSAWRAERLRIDEARIERQKAADGRWRREWDNEKVNRQFEDEPRFEQSRDAEHRRGCPQHQHRDLHDHRHHEHHDHRHHDHHDHRHHDYHDHRHHDHHHQHVSHGQSYVPASVPRQLPREVHGRGRGRFDPSQLEMPHIEVLNKPDSPVKPAVPAQQYPNAQQIVALEKTPPSQVKFVRDSPRSVGCDGHSLKISISNASPPKSTPKGQRSGDRRPRPQPSYSSQSDEDSPRDRAPRRQRAPRHQRNQPRTPMDRKATMSGDSAEKSELRPQNKPPLPPWRAEQKVKKEEVPEVTSNAAGEDSWEDVTTSGAESMNEEIPVQTVVQELVTDEKVPPVDYGTRAPLNLSIQPSDQPFDQYLNLVKADGESLQGVTTGQAEHFVGNHDSSLPVTNDLYLAADDCSSIKALEMSHTDLRSAQEQFDDKYVVVDESENAESVDVKRSDAPTSDSSTKTEGVSDINVSKSADALIVSVGDINGGVNIKGDIDSVSVGDSETKLMEKLEDGEIAGEICEKREVVVEAAESLNDTVEDKNAQGKEVELDKTLVSDASSKEQNVCENLKQESLNDTVEVKNDAGKEVELDKTLVSDASSKEQNVCENLKQDVQSELTNMEKEK